MKFHHIVRLTTLAIAALAANAQAELVTNGSFEQYTPGPFGNYYRVVTAGSSDLVGWTIGLTSVDVIYGSFGAISGNSVDMLGSPGPGSISQTLSTVIGQQYLLQFDLSSNRGGDNTTAGKAMTVGSLGGGGAQTYSALSPGIFHQTYSFTADTNATLLSFSSGPAGYSGAVLDNVSVTSVPEPESFAMLLAGLCLMGGMAVRRQAKERRSLLA